MSRNTLNPGFFATTAADIDRLCRYIGDDQTIANYFGIARDRVELVRANMRPSEPRRFKQERAVYKNSSFGYTSHIVDSEMAAMGSRRLNAAIQKMFRRWERDHGFQEGAGARLLPAGYSPELRAA